VDAPAEGTHEHEYYEHIAHELRGSVHSVLAFLAILLDERAGALTPVQREFLTTMSTSVRRITRLSHDLDIVASGGAVPLLTELVDVLNVAEFCCREVSVLAAACGVRIALSAADRGSWTLVADPIRLQQIMINLLENAIRYASPDSTVQISLRNSSTRMLLAVSNNVQREIDNVTPDWFAPFTRGPEGRNRHAHGRGLGLAICQTLVRAHHGRLVARARSGMITIAATLPRRRAE
jgi:signal transduction histidine kinase